MSESDAAVLRDYAAQCREAAERGISKHREALLALARKYEEEAERLTREAGSTETAETQSARTETTR